MSFSIIIPARYNASRFPGKLLALLGDKTVLEHTWLSACKSSADQVIIATDDQRIADVAQTFGASTCMTDNTLASGTDRVYQAAKIMGIDDSRIIINLQADEPLFASDDIDRLYQALNQDDSAHMASMMRRFADDEHIDNLNQVKVVINNYNHALYFSRSTIPYPRQKQSCHYQHMGIYAYSMHLLNRFVHWPPSDLEKTEQLEQLRVLSNGENIRMVESLHGKTRGVDTPEDLAFLEKLMQSSEPMSQ